MLAAEPAARAYVRRFIQVDELLYGSNRWCLWLADAPPGALKDMPLVLARVRRVAAYRKASKREATKRLAESPALFGEIRQPASPYLVVPRHTGESRCYIPMAYEKPKVVCGDANLMLTNATPYAFGVLTSIMHMAWVRAVCGRIKSDYRYSVRIVYNNFPWPEPTPKQEEAIAAAAQSVLDARAGFSASSLADLYGEATMPAPLVKAHTVLDRAVDTAYGRRSFASEAKRVAFLFERYEALAAPLVSTSKPAAGKRKRTVPTGKEPASISN